MLAEMKTGIAVSGDGAVGPMRGDKVGAAVMTPAHAQYVEPCYRQMIMMASNAVAGVAHGTAFSVTPPLALWNPPSSGRSLAVLRLSLGYVSGTLGAGTIALGQIASQVTVPTTGTEITPVCTCIGYPRGVGRAFTGSTFVSAPTILRPAWNIGPMLATSVYQPSDSDVLVDGGIVLPPGTAIALQGIATAGTSPLVIFSIVYEELPYV
jgi:hypothetical protein